jgi:hypothetical protein
VKFSLPSGLQSCTRNYLLHREERKHQQRARLLTEAILRRHWLVVPAGQTVVNPPGLGLSVEIG